MRWRRLELMIWAFLLSLAYYPGWFGFIAWFALVRPLWILSRLEMSDVFRAAYFFGFFFQLFSLYWIGQVTPPGTIMAVLIVSFYYAFTLYFFVRVYKFKRWMGLVALPFLWVGMEYFRSLSEVAFPWSDLGYTQSYYDYILQTVSIISVHGLSLIILTVNVLLWQVLDKTNSPARKVTAGYVSVAILLLTIAIGWMISPYKVPPGDEDVVLLQGSVPIEAKWGEGNEDFSFNLYDSLALSVEVSDSSLFVWPETSAPAYLSHDYSRRGRVSRLAHATKGYHLVGAMAATQIDDKYQHHNSAYFFGPDGHIQARHDKVKLVPFTEQVPYQSYFPFLSREYLTQYLTFIETYNVNWWSDFVPGDSAVLFDWKGHKLGTLICFESAFGDYARQMVLSGAEVLVGITNDTWFGHSVGIHMHSRIFVTRVVENRVWGVRVANSGLSYVVDPYGQIRTGLDLDAVAALKGKVRFQHDESVYAQVGDVAGLGSLLITLSIIGIMLCIWLLRKLGIGSRKAS